MWPMLFKKSGQNVFTNGRIGTHNAKLPNITNKTGKKYDKLTIKL